MKLLSLLTCALATLAGLVGTAAAHSVCQSSAYGWDRKWIVSIHPVPEDQVEPICGLLWWGLKRHFFCSLSLDESEGSCKEWAAKTNGTFEDGLQWRFETNRFCNSGMVHSAFWEATKNKYGAISCIML